MPERPVVVVLTTGGTIASLRRPEGDVVAALPGEALLPAAEPDDATLDVEVHETMRIGSYLLDAASMLEIAAALRRHAARPEVHGIVVTHGTDTMEETAYLADLLHDGPQPIVFTGAQRHAGTADFDGPANLVDAIRLAAEPAARGLGALIALGGRIDAACGAAKLHTTAPRAFGTLAPAGAVGEIERDRVRIVRRPPAWQPLPFPAALEPAVHLVKLVSGIDATLLDAAVAAGARGLVLECFGLGNANHAVVEGVRRAVAAGVETVVVSRCPEGGVAPVYGNGGGHDLAAAGARFGGTLSGPQARILLMAALPAAAGDRDALDALLAPRMVALPRA